MASTAFLSRNFLSKPSRHSISCPRRTCRRNRRRSARRPKHRKSAVSKCDFRKLENHARALYRRIFHQVALKTTSSQREDKRRDRFVTGVKTSRANYTPCGGDPDCWLGLPGPAKMLNPRQPPFPCVTVADRRSSAVTGSVLTAFSLRLIWPLLLLGFADFSAPYSRPTLKVELRSVACVSFWAQESPWSLTEHRRNDRSRHIRRATHACIRRCLPRFEPGRAAQIRQDAVLLEGALARSARSLGEVLLAPGEVLLRGAPGEVLLGCGECSWRGAWRGALARCSGEVRRCSWRGCSCEVLRRCALGECCGLLLASALGEVLLARCSWLALLRGALGEGALGEVLLGEVLLRGAACEVQLLCEVLLARCSWLSALGEVAAWRGALGEGVLASCPGELGKVLARCPGGCSWRGAPGEVLLARCFLARVLLARCSWRVSRLLLVVLAALPVLAFGAAVTCRYGDRTLRPGQSHVFEQNCARHNCTCSPGVAGSDMCKSTMIGCLERRAAGATRLARRSHGDRRQRPDADCVCQRDSDGSFTFANCRTGQRSHSERPASPYIAPAPEVDGFQNCRPSGGCAQRGQVPGRGLGQLRGGRRPATTERDGAVLHCTCAAATNAYVNCGLRSAKTSADPKKKPARNSTTPASARTSRAANVDRGQRYRVRYGGGALRVHLRDGDNRARSAAPSGPAAPAEAGNGSVSEGLNSARLSGAIKKLISNYDNRLRPNFG
uniref:VWFD domain-containing protein n=1 Tax=Macrostomum lignano TaxID=282301 RepID=A0A1I8FHB5_9PLAT